MTRTWLWMALCWMATAGQAQGPACPKVSSVEIAHGSFEAEPGVRYDLSGFQARLLPKGKTAPQCYSRITVVSKGDIFASSDSLTRLFAEKLQASHSKIKDFAVTHDAEGATLTGSITKLIPVHFSIKGPVSTDGSLIRLDARSVKADGIPVKELLTLLGAELSALIPAKDMPGLQIGKDYLAFSPEAVADLKGHIASVTTSDKGLTVRYTPAPRHTAKVAH